jgi:hypothetical protein
MKSKTITGILVLLFALVGTSLGGATVKIIPSAVELLGGTPASAYAFSAEQVEPLAPVGSGFTYQGRLLNNGSPANGNYDFRFTLFDDPSAGSQVGNPVSQAAVPVAGGLFTTILNFGSASSIFNGEARYLHIEVKPAGGPSYTTLSPRQPITPAPYALYALKTQGYKNVVTVAGSGGDHTSLAAALSSISDNSVENRYLVRVAPGVYTETVAMKQWVDIEGSGVNNTIISWPGSSASTTGTITGANNAELRHMTVRNTGGSTFGIAIYNGGTSPSLLHLAATAYGNSSNIYTVYNTSNAAPRMADMRVTASGSGTIIRAVFNNGSSPVMENITATASGMVSIQAVFNANGSSPAITNLTATASGGGTNVGVYNYIDSSPTMTNVTAKASGGADGYGVYNISNSSPRMSNVAATAEGAGGGNRYGVANSGSSPAMHNVVATASGGSTNYGVFTCCGGAPGMNNVTATASGGTNSYGLYNDSVSQPATIPPITNLTASASGATNNYGVYNNYASLTIQNSSISAGTSANSYGIYNEAATGSYTVNVDNTKITSVSAAIRNTSAYTTRVGASQLSGATVAGGGTFRCAASYNGSYNPLSSLCTYP